MNETDGGDTFPRMSGLGWLDNAIEYIRASIPDDVVDWWHHTWLFLRFFKVEAKLLLVGLDNAGKTTLIGRLSGKHLRSNMPTQRATSEEMRSGPVSFRCFDLGGAADQRETWQEYYVGADAIIFMVDAADPRRFEEARAELNAVLTNPTLKSAPVAVFGNKIDLPKAVSEGTLRAALGLVHTTGKDPAHSGDLRPIELFMGSVVAQQGFREMIYWIRWYVENTEPEEE